ncbi:hypothetical protein HII31_06740 [Pseudocercospora fuligena]|uniref:Uncharacterized protein n=1 Tax=Pseudocercospora fuligena TaxID=685502 RepID=A0A8H6VMB1_9PEZI|nr:hypothetical protein HII31_06740 [Pseudocercospora fuligena]
MMNIKTSPDNPRNYWYLTLFDDKGSIQRRLQSAGVSYLKGLNLAGLQAVYTRYLRDLLDYNKCSNDELLKFCTDRGLLPVPDVEGKKTKHKAKKVMIRHLEAADDTKTFDRLMSLPAELRVLIYEWYFRDLDLSPEAQGRDAFGIPTVKSQPPLTKTCRVIREESLPIFYQESTFHIRLWTSKGLGAMFNDIYMNRLLETAPKAVLDQVVKVRIRGEITYETAGGSAAKFRDGMGVLLEAHSNWEVDIAPGEVVLRQTDDPRYTSKEQMFGNSGPEYVRRTMNWRKKKFLDGRGASKKRKFRLRRQDRTAIPEMFAWIPVGRLRSE